MSSGSRLIDGYTCHPLEPNEFRPFFDRHHGEIFRDHTMLDLDAILSDDERARNAPLLERARGLYRLTLGIFCGEELVGWTFGRQETHEKYYMTNTALLPEHRGKGVYKALLPAVLSILEKEGFQVVYSRHSATNNEVIVPKLKAGFVISGMELSDQFGTLVYLSYFFNPVRRRVVDVRCGQATPDEEIRRVLGF